ncbi:substrate-binding and VWA domain-containing protein [Terrabacter aerolatus]|uniref:VWFA domain-containing protein n=1 Tax=Terrabacter aerolatus TaxID=422442 RepID=A0A512D5G0_9MICO|nr:substrate-binding domain-containing protein [Terrabacter aerolatus]GEO31698.1 hypothetical protein TAE01_35080 [Terrabacter aerolatus]
MTAPGGVDPEGSDAPRRRIGPYEQSLRETRERAEAAARQRAHRRRRTRAVAVLATVVVACGLGYGAYRYVGAREVPTAVPTVAVRPTSCAHPVKVRVAVAPAAAPAVAAVAASLARRPDAPCAAYSVESAEPYAVSGSLAGAGRPDAWVTDSPVWLGRAAAVSGAAPAAVPAFASSPVLVAMADDDAAALGTRLGWADLLGATTPVRLPDPNRSALARNVLGVAATSLPAARLQSFVAATAPSSGAAVTLDGLAGPGAGGAVVSQAQLLAWNSAHPDQALAAVAPTEGAPPLEYSLVALTTDPARARLVTALASYLTSADSQKLLQDSGFRTATGGPKDPSPLHGEIREVAAGSDGALAPLTAQWSEASRKTQTLLALDVSGSMLERTDDGSRLAVVQQATVRALGAVPATAMASLWIYSLHVGSHADDFRQLTDYASLGDPKSLTAVDTAVTGLDGYVGGGSGLYDTIAATYDRARSAWRPGYTNTVVVVADGPNEDDYGLSLDLLKQHLAAAKDPKRPITVVVVGIGGRADAAAMRQVVAVTGGQYVATETYADLQPVLTQALGG